MESIWLRDQGSSRALRPREIHAGKRRTHHNCVPKIHHSEFPDLSILQSLIHASKRMGILVAHSTPARLIIKRSLQRQHNISSSARRQQSNAPKRPTNKSSSPLTKASGKSLSTAKELSPRPFWERLGPLSEAFGAYSRTQKRKPYATQIGTSLVVYLCGDLIAQNIDGESYNPLRTLRHLTIGGICSIPAYSWWAANLIFYEEPRS